MAQQVKDPAVVTAAAWVAAEAFDSRPGKFHLPYTEGMAPPKKQKLVK